MSLPAGFLELPHELYADDPHWIPERREQVAALFSDANPWRGRKQAFCIPGRARVATFRPDGLTIDGRPAAFFGYYEGEGGVLGDAFDWARSQGARVIYGPIDFTTAQPYRLRLSGPPDAYLDEPYNAASYPSQLEAAGLTLARRYVSQEADMHALAVFAPPLPAGYGLEPLTPETWLSRAEELLPVGNEVFASNFAFTPLSREEFGLHFGERWAARLHPELSLLVLGPDDRIAGIALVYPHYGPLVSNGAGRGRIPVDQLSYAAHGRELTEVVFKTGGVTSAHRELGIAGAVAGEISRRALAAGVTRMLIGPMREDNPSRRVVDRGHHGERWYGLYARPLA